MKREKNPSKWVTLFLFKQMIQVSLSLSLSSPLNKLWRTHLCAHTYEIGVDNGQRSSVVEEK